MIGAFTGMLVACAGGIAACSGSAPTLNNDDYTFTNPDTPTAECDEGMTIDGVLDEAIYNEEGRTWLELSKREGDGLGTAELRMTTAYGEKGLYIVFDVDESNHIWVNPNRDIYINSGIEMYLAVDGVTHIDDRGSFEINLCSDGSLSVKMGGGAELGGRGVVNTTYDKMPVLGAQTKNGAVNSNTCTGYTLEFFIPYVFTDYLGLERSSLENLYINPVLISSLDYETTDYTMGREWFSFGEHKLDGYEWGNPSHSYPFGENGAKTHAVTIENTSSAGTIAEVNGYDYAVDGHSASFVVNEGDSRLTGLSVNGADAMGSVRYDADGYAVGFTVGNVTEDLSISATFSELSETPVVVRVNGTTVSGASVEVENGTLSFGDPETCSVKRVFSDVAPDMRKGILQIERLYIPPRLLFGELPHILVIDKLFLDCTWEHARNNDRSRENISLTVADMGHITTDLEYTANVDLLSPDADVVVSSAKRLSAFAAVWLPPSRPALVGSGQRKYQTIQGQDRRKRIAFGGLWKGRLKSISSRFRETPPAGRPTNCEPSAAGRSWKGGARERADDVFLSLA